MSKTENTENTENLDRVIMQAPTRESRFALKIENFDSEGRGTGEHQGWNVAVRGAFPGDYVAVRVEKVIKSKQLIQARVHKVIHPSEDRIERRCSHKMPCPGCPFEGLSIPKQLEQKTARIQRALDSIELTSELREKLQEQFKVDEVITPDPYYGQRQKVKLAAQDIAGRIHFGMYVPYTHLLRPATECPFTREQIQKAAKHIQRELQSLRIPAMSKTTPGIKALILRAFKDGVRAVLVTSQPMNDSLWDAMVHHITGDGIIKSLSERVDLSTGNSVVGGEIVREHGEVLGKPLRGGPKEAVDAFCQSIPSMATWIYKRSAQFLSASKHKNKYFLDLFAGTGGFSRELFKKKAKKVVAMEREEDMRQSLEETGATAMMGDINETLESLKGQEFSGIVADPPRKGLGKELALKVAGFKAERVALVSCSAESMAKDLKVFLEHGYQIRHIIPVDLFPGTPQIEVLSLLYRD